MLTLDEVTVKRDELRLATTVFDPKRDSHRPGHARRHLRSIQCEEKIGHRAWPGQNPQRESGCDATSGTRCSGHETNRVPYESLLTWTTFSCRPVLHARSERPAIRTDL